MSRFSPSHAAIHHRLNSPPRVPSLLHEPPRCSPPALSLQLPFTRARAFLLFPHPHKHSALVD
ncbi:dimethyladenosine transferase dimethyltransferase [Schaalia cardiffensis F0333]|uniref:Dimethyladenosine transferase dimethyltransferase n=1 Tax=Schaalia cardiffensis F0333 TaxID=888050 RepID=N6W842_9ACTO|nr:dimethyladenosine transferase dimethyltransferase [Schaalia cardiffensis F0333]